MTDAEPPDRLLRRRADEICRLIAHTDYPAVDLVIMVNQLALWCEDVMPDKLALFEMVYVSRFRRLWRRHRAEHWPAP